MDPELEEDEAYVELQNAGIFRVFKNRKLQIHEIPPDNVNVAKRTISICNGSTDNQITPDNKCLTRK